MSPERFGKGRSERTILESNGWCPFLERAAFLSIKPLDLPSPCIRFLFALEYGDGHGTAPFTVAVPRGSGFCIAGIGEPCQRLESGRFSRSSG